MQVRLLRPVIVSVVLATARGNRHRDVFDVLLWAGGLLLVVALAVVCLMAFRRHLRRSANKAQVSGFSLDQLHEMKRRGELSDAEYNALRQTLIEQLSSTGDVGKG